MRRVGVMRDGNLVGAAFDGLMWLTEIERGGLTEDVEADLKESGNLALFELGSGGGTDLEGNLLVVMDLARGGGTGGSTESVIAGCVIRGCFLERTIVNGGGVRPMVPVLSLLAILHSSSQAGII